MKHDELSYYGLKLKAFLIESHPELLKNPKFIVNRADFAAETYSQCIKNGLSHPQAEESANGVLYKGLLFSKHDTIVNILWDEFISLIPEDNAKDIAIGLLPHCKEVFEKYTLTDDFAYSSEYDKLYTELVGAIQIWLDKNEL